MLTIVVGLSAQNTGNNNAKAMISDAAWLTGTWKGENDWGISEETWTTSAGGSMACLYRLTKNGKPVFYEFLVLMEFNGSLKLRLKHFSENMKAWEEKDETVDFLLREVSPAKLVFRGDEIKKTLTFEKLTETSMEITLESVDNGQLNTTKFMMKRN